MFRVNVKVVNCVLSLSTADKWVDFVDFVEFMSICVEFLFSSRQMSLYKGSLRGLLVTQCCHDYNVPWYGV